MPVAQYLCDNCKNVLDEVGSEKYPANMTYSPPHTISHLFRCTSNGCNSHFVAFEDSTGRWQWETREKHVFNKILEGINERREREALKEEKGKLQQEKAQLEKMVTENPKKISVIKGEMDNIKTQVNKLTDEYEERSIQCENLEEAVSKGKKRLEEVEKRLIELMHIKLN